MIHKGLQLALCALWVGAVSVHAEQNLLKKPDALHGLVTAKAVDKATRAQLDLAVWTDNALFTEPGGSPTPTTPVSAMVMDSLKKFPWAASIIKALPKPSRAQPFAWGALKRAAVLEAGCDTWNSIAADLGRYPQLRVQRVWIDASGPTPQYWLEAQDASLRPLGFVQLRNEVLGQTTASFMRWLQPYASQPLDSAQVLDWATQTASYWYPSLNTDLVWDLPLAPWPGDAVESAVKTWLHGQTILSPTLVIRGNPLGTPHYTVVVVDKMHPVARRGGEAAVKAGHAGTPKMADRQLPANYVRNQETWTAELAAHGGSYAAWDLELEPWHQRWRALLDSLPKEQMGFAGSRDYLFFRRSLASVIATDWEKLEGTAAPLPPLIDFKTRLEEAEVNMLFVPVPTKTEIYPDLLPGGDASLIGKIVNPWQRWLGSEAQNQGMEIIDLLPPFLAVRQQEKTGDEMLYQKDDTHWTRRGMLMTAEILAQRIKQYAWYAELKPDTARFSRKDTTFARLGDIVERLPAAQQGQYPPMQLAGSRVLKDGKPYKGEKGAPIVIIGDSFTGVMESVDCRNGGVGAHLARLTGLDVEVITSWGGGPNVRGKFLKARKAQLAEARLVIYLMTARDLYRYPEGWEPLNGVAP